MRKGPTSLGSVRDDFAARNAQGSRAIEMDRCGDRSLSAASDSGLARKSDVGSETISGNRGCRLFDYTIDDNGRRIPAPPHHSRDDLVRNHGVRSHEGHRYSWAAFKKAKQASRAAQRKLHLTEPAESSVKGRPRTQIPVSPAFTAPLFPPLPLYGPPSYVRSLEIYAFRFISFWCTLGFLLVVILGALFTSLLPATFSRIWQWMTFRDPDRHRKFIHEERRIKEDTSHLHVKVTDDVSYYASLVDIEIEHFTCETLDGFTLHLQRLHDKRPQAAKASEKYPILMVHGLLQSSGAFCANDEQSLAFYLCRQGFDVWLGNNRCWLKPEHSVLQYGDPRLWAWNIRQLGGLDLPAMLRTVCDSTNRRRIGFVGHSQGTTQTFCSLSRDQSPETGRMMDSFCALAPAVFAGALIDKLQFKFMRALGPNGFRLFFGINAFIPLMMTMQSFLPGSWYGQVGYLVFNFLFGWSDGLWDRRLKSRFFQFSPVYVSSESMRWWMRDFAIYRSILEDSDQVWYRREHFPPLSFWTCGKDGLVDGAKFTERMNQRENEITIVHQECLEDYSHLDVIWAMDVPERVGKKLKEILWQCATDREQYIVPLGCNDIAHFPDPRADCITRSNEACRADEE